MNLRIISFVTYIFFVLSHEAFAAISVLSMNADPGVITYSKVTLDGRKDSFVTSRVVNGKAIVRLSPITNHVGKARDLVTPFLAVFLAVGDNSDLLIGANSNGEWIASRISTDKKIEQAEKLVDFSVVAGVTTSVSGYIVSGRGSNGKPRVVLLDRNLRVTRTFSQNGAGAGEAVVVGDDKGTVTVMMNYESGKSSIVWLSNTLSLIREVALDGGAASGIFVEDGVAVTYSVAKEVFVEALDKLGHSKWKKLVHKRSGISSLKFGLGSIPNGVGVIGMNDSALMVTRVEHGGTISKTSSDKSGLLPPTDSRYVVSTEGNEIHILGVAIKSGSDAHAPPLLFHFVDKP